MTRRQAIQIILQFSYPLGPLGDMDELEHQIEAWALSATGEDLDSLLDLTRHPPRTSELAGVEEEEFEFVLSRVLMLIGARNPSLFVARVAPLLQDANARKTIIRVISKFGLDDVAMHLESLLDRPDLTEEEVVRLACAFGESKRPVGVLLDRLAAATPPEWHRAIDEIEIAREWNAEAEK